MRNPTIPFLALLIGLAGAPVSAQVAPPPPAQEDKPAEYTPRSAPQRPAAQPDEQQRPRRQPSQRVDSIPTNIPYPKLAQIGEDGRIIRLKELPDILALRANPTVGPKSVDAIMPVIYGRRARFEMLVIDNLDLLWELRDGAIDNVDMNNLSDLAQLTEMIKPLVGRTTLSEELTNRGILSRMQGGMKEHIVREYKQAISEEIQAQEGVDGMMNFMRFILHDSIHEANNAYYAMMVELGVVAPTLVEQLGLEGTALASLEPMQDNEEEEGVDDRDERVEATDQALRSLGVDRAIEVLNAMREMRENPNVSPTIVRIDVLHDRKSDASDSALGARVERRPTPPGQRGRDADEGDETPPRDD